MNVGNETNATSSYLNRNNILDGINITFIFFLHLSVQKRMMTPNEYTNAGVNIKNRPNEAITFSINNILVRTTCSV